MSTYLPYSFDSKPEPRVHDLVDCCGGNTGLAAALIVALKSDNAIVHECLERLVVATQLADGEAIGEIEKTLVTQLKERHKHRSTNSMKLRMMMLEAFPAMTSKLLLKPGDV